MDVQCLVCSGLMHKSLRYEGLLSCELCDFKTADIEINLEELKSIYGHDYFHGDEYADYVSDKSVLQKNFNYRINEILNLPEISGDEKLFEIGCAYGFFLDVAKNNFSEVAGVDISQSAANYANSEMGVNAICGDFISTDIPFSPNIICMWDVIEHMKSPDEAIQKASEILLPNGYICITTGDIGSLNARIRGRKWRMIHPPSHLHYFDKNNLSKLLAKHGLKEVSVTYPPVVRTVRSILDGVLRFKWNLKKLHGYMSLIPGQDIPVPINLYDIMFMVAQKK